ncbi:hypothetical protein BP6252_08432 [Coleophoma cylindrospora]|uniref:HAD-like protein n=1 Tax=Coleophoma cylindrospora TaxID=1849047 RepID=A0A3D8R5T4_9HELO|nr:hypothetical protein BP6252_08432 [Coleophoma cylindrospora]
MDGLLLDSEDKYSICTNLMLAKYGKPPMPWSIKAQLQGRPGPAAGAIFQAWAQLPISLDEYYEQLKELQKVHFPQSKPLPGVEKLMKDLSTAKAASGEKLHIALATSSHAENFNMKTGHLTELFEVFTPERRVLGDDTRIGKGRGKPAPDIYLLALKTINDSLVPGEKEVTLDECLVFEDSVPGVEAGRRAGMRVVWCPHPELLGEYKGREDLVLAGATGEGGTEAQDGKIGEVGDGWSQYLQTLENFPYEKYGIAV